MVSKGMKIKAANLNYTERSFQVQEIVKHVKVWQSGVGKIVKELVQLDTADRKVN